MTRSPNYDTPARIRPLGAANGFGTLLMNVFAVFTAHVRAAVGALHDAGVFASPPDLGRIIVEPPREASHGDLATNAAMVLAKEAALKPRDLAEKIAVELKKRPEITNVEVAGPGFINMTLDPLVWRAALVDAILKGKDFGKSDIGKGEPVNVEYVSANPTGPMHVGHGRGAVFGDALAALLAFTGFNVTREYYINDAGVQVDALAQSAFARYREALGEDISAIPKGPYPGDYLKPVGATLAAEYGRALSQMSQSDWLPIVRNKAIAMMMAEIRDDLAALNIRQDVFFSERSLVEGSSDRVASTIDWLRARGDVYEGRLPPPKGGTPIEDWEDRDQLLFRATAFGDDIDRPLKKSDGGYTYFASDIAYHKSKFDRGFRDMIDVWGADHKGYIKRMQAAVAAISEGKAGLDVKLVEMVKLLRGGKPVTMSKREGQYESVRELVDEVGRDAVRFMMLYRKNDAVLEFDLAKVIEQSKDNPVYYVQYGHARGQQVFRRARADAIPDLPEQPEARAKFLARADLDRLEDSNTEGFAELALSLMRRIALYPRIVEAAAVAHEPHRIAFYLYDLASEFHALYTKGNDLPHLRFIIENTPIITKARLAVVEGVVTIIASGLDLLGVEAPDEMR